MTTTPTCGFCGAAPRRQERAEGGSGGACAEHQRCVAGDDRRVFLVVGCSLSGSRAGAGAWLPTRPGRSAPANRPSVLQRRAADLDRAWPARACPGSEASPYMRCIRRRQGASAMASTGMADGGDGGRDETHPLGLVEAGEEEVAGDGEAELAEHLVGDQRAAVVEGEQRVAGPWARGRGGRGGRGRMVSASRPDSIRADRRAPAARRRPSVRGCW